MFTALGSPKGALIGLSAAALIVAVSYSLYGGPVQPVAGLLQSLPVGAPASPAAAKVLAPAAAPAPVAATPREELVTASVDARASAWAKPTMPAAVEPPAIKATAAFRDALGLIRDGKHAEAYALARGFDSSVERRAVQWAAITYGNGAVDAEAIKRFEADAPEFVNATTFKTRLEQALTRSAADGATLREHLSGAMPNTLAAQIALADAYLAAGETKRATNIARSIWTEQFLDRQGEERMLKKFGKLLTNDDHWARAMHLMMHDRATGTERLFKYMTPAQKSLAIARNAVSRNDKDAKKLLDAVDPTMRSNPVYNFSRAQRARQFELWDDAIAYLDKGKGPVPDSAEWWYQRQSITRTMLGAGDYKRAYRAAAGFTDGPDGRVVEAQFHAGWIALSFLGDAEAAVVHFEAMRERATLPDTITQSNFWLGRALAKTGDAEGSKAAYELAATFPTVYYGQLAREALGLSPVEIRDLPAWQDREAEFARNEVVQAVRLLADNGERDKAGALLRNYSQRITDGGQLVLAARLAQSLEAPHLSISIAEIGERKGTPLDLFSFPEDGLPRTKIAALDTAAVYAVARQESRFQVNAVSSAGARGLMQLMPGTAKDTARKLGVTYSPAKLTSDPVYNAVLGSDYLDTQLRKYDGSLLLAAAAYNAGPGNANKWIRAFGDPRSGEIDPLDWVELIPFAETRKYVQRVLGNYMVYRARLGGEPINMADAMHAIH